MDYDYRDYADYASSSFERDYRCYPVSFLEKPHLEMGDKIIMPPSALNCLASLNIEYPMLFELSNPAAKRVTHCGVMEFIADEGLVYLPSWMMKNMLLQEGEVVHLKNATLPKGTYVKLQPHTKDFLDISNPKALLETALRHYSCLTTGDTIVVPYNNKNYCIDIVETKPFKGVSIIETDCEVDFAPPLDYVEPAKPAPMPSVEALDAEKDTKEEPKFVAFTGVGRRLDGKPSSLEAPTTPIIKPHQLEPTNGVTATNASSRKRSGTLVFGSNSARSQKEATKVPAENANVEPQKKEEQKFQSFTGKGYSLRG